MAIQVHVIDIAHKIRDKKGKEIINLIKMMLINISGNSWMKNKKPSEFYMFKKMVNQADIKMGFMISFFKIKNF